MTQKDVEENQINSAAENGDEDEDEEVQEENEDDGEANGMGCEATKTEEEDMLSDGEPDSVAGPDGVFKKK